MKSLRSKVFVGVLCGLLLVTAAAEILLYRQAVFFAEKELFSSLKRYAVALAGVGVFDPRTGFTLYHDWESRIKVGPEDRPQFFEFKTATGTHLTDSHNLGGDSLPEVGEHQGEKLVDYGAIDLGIYEHHFSMASGNRKELPLKLVVAENTELISSARDSTLRGLLYFTPLALLAAFLTSLALTTITLSSIGRFTRRVQTSSRTDNTSRLELDSIDKEMQPLGEAINKYMYQLNKHTNLESKLLADTAHEIREPLATMRKELVLLKQAGQSPAEVSIHADNLDKNLSGLQAMTDNMLMLYRIESGNYNPRLTSIELLTELQSIVRPYHKNKETEIEIKGEEVTIVSNRSVVNLIVTRLLNNAIQHAAGSRVLINWDITSAGVELHVDDAGRGIPEIDRERIFDRHYRFQDHKQSATSGTGLGLVLVRLYANTVNAKTFCVDSPLGGARFTVLFPAESGKQAEFSTNTRNTQLERAVT